MTTDEIRAALPVRIKHLPGIQEVLLYSDTFPGVDGPWPFATFEYSGAPYLEAATLAMARLTCEALNGLRQEAAT